MATADRPVSPTGAEPVVDLPEAPYPAAAQAARLCAQLHALLEQVREAERETVAAPLRRALEPSCAGLPARDCGLVAEAALRGHRERAGEALDAGQAGYSSVLEEVARIVAEPHTGLARSLAERLQRALGGASPPGARRARTQEAELRELVEAVRTARHARGTYATHGLMAAVDALLAAVPAPPPPAPEDAR